MIPEEPVEVEKVAETLIEILLSGSGKSGIELVVENGSISARPEDGGLYWYQIKGEYFDLDSGPASAQCYDSNLLHGSNRCAGWFTIKKKAWHKYIVGEEGKAVLHINDPGEMEIRTRGSGSVVCSNQVRIPVMGCEVDLQGRRLKVKGYK